MDNAKVERFWAWFAENAGRLARFDTDQAQLANEVGDALRRLHQPEGYDGRGPSLGFDFGPKKDGLREFIITSDAIPSAFHLARQLASAAPAIPGW